jgi:hypothetical protein
MVLFPKMSEVIRRAHRWGSHCSCINLHLLKRFMEMDDFVGVGGVGVRSRRDDL